MLGYFGSRGKAWRSSRDSAAMFWFGFACGTAGSTVPPARSILVSVALLEAAIEGNIVADFPLATSRSTVPIRAMISKDGTRCASCCLKVCSACHSPKRAPSPDDASGDRARNSVAQAARRRLGRSLSIREVDAGSCNGCELEILL